MNLRNPAAACSRDPGPGRRPDHDDGRRGGRPASAAAVAALAAAVPASTPKVIQNCGKFRACASHRPRSFQLYRHSRINDIRWRRYTPTRAVGLGWFGHAKHVCNDHVPAVKDTCVLAGLFFTGDT